MFIFPMTVGVVVSGLEIMIRVAVIMAVNVGMSMGVMRIGQVPLFQPSKTRYHHHSPHTCDDQTRDQTEPGIELIWQNET